MDETLQPLCERTDYAADGYDQLEKQFVHLPSEDQKVLEDQFKDRLRRTSMNNVDRIASEILASEKVAVSPPGWSGTTKAMKKHKGITNPWALSWWMSKRKPGEKWGPGGKLHKKPEPHYKEEKKKKSFAQKVSQILNDIMVDEVVTIPQINITESNKSYSTVDTVKSGNNYITIKTNYKEENGQPVLEEYIVDKDGDVQKYDNTEAFVQRMMSENLL